MTRSRGVVGGIPRSPPPKTSTLSRSMQYARCGPSQGGGGRGPSPISRNTIHDKYNRNPSGGGNIVTGLDMKEHRLNDRDRSLERRCSNSNDGHVKVQRSSRHSPLEDPRLKNRPPEPPEPSSSAVTTATTATASVPKKKKKKNKEVEPKITNLNLMILLLLIDFYFELI